jgi:hypothetical protein
VENLPTEMLLLRYVPLDGGSFVTGHLLGGTGDFGYAAKK